MVTLSCARHGGATKIAPSQQNMADLLDIDDIVRLLNPNPPSSSLGGQSDFLISWRPPIVAQ